MSYLNLRNLVSHVDASSIKQVHGGRPCTQFRGKDLPPGLTVCGDHVATATLNGALESGINAGKEAAKFAAEKSSTKA